MLTVNQCFQKNNFSKTHRGSWIKHEVFHKKNTFLKKTHEKVNILEIYRR